MSDMLQLVVSGDGVSFDSHRQAEAYRTLPLVFEPVWSLLCPRAVWVFVM